MRITTNMIYDRNLATMSKVSERQNTAYNQLMSGDKFTRAGEDPSGMSQKMALTKEIDLFKQYGVNGSLLGLPLSNLRNDTDLQVGTLPLLFQESVSKGIPATDQADAERIVSALRQEAAQCQTILPPAGCPGAPQ